MKALLKDDRTWLVCASFLFAVLVTGPIGNRIWDWPNVWPWALVGLLATLLIWWWRRNVNKRTAVVRKNQEAIESDQSRVEQLKQQFALCKNAEDLRPQDLGFQPIWPGQPADPHFRPYHATYVPRTIVLAEDAANTQHSVTFTESDLRDELRGQTSFMLLGPPTMGKSCTLFEIVRGMSGWLVVSPRKDRETPAREAFEELFTGRQVVLLLEDLNDYADATVDLSAFVGSNGLGLAGGWAIAASCRDGAELGAVRESVGRSLRRMFDEIRLKLVLLPQTPQEKSDLARIAGKEDWDEEHADNYPTPGAIVMEDALLFMRARFDLLSPERKDVLRTLRLLADLGILPLSHRRVTAVLSGIFHRDPDHLLDHLDSLSDQAFLHYPGAQDPIFPEPAYLDGSIVRSAARGAFVEDFHAVLQVLQDGRDSRGLVMLGLTSAIVHGDHLTAIEAYNAAMAIDASEQFAVGNRGVSLLALGKAEDALADFDEAIRLAPDEPIAYSNRAAALGELGRHDESLLSLDAALERGADMPETNINRATALKALNRNPEALDAVSLILKSDPEHPGALSVRGGILVDSGEYEEALRDINASLRLRSGFPKTHFNRGLALYRTGKYSQALQAFEQASVTENVPPQSQTDPFLLHYHRAMALVELDRDEEALDQYSAAIALRPEDTAALFNRGVTNCDLSHFEDAVNDFQSVISIEPNHADAASGLKYALDKLETESR